LRLSLPLSFFAFLLLLGVNSHAEVEIIEADSTYIMGDNDSKVDARRIALQEAKRKALELAGTYIENLTQVQNYQLTNDEIKSYTAGILETEVVSERMGGTTDHPEISIKTRCKIDTDILTAQINRFRASEDLKEQLSAAAREKDALQKERDALVKQLAAQTSKTKAEAARSKLDTVLAKEEANDETNKVWMNIGPQLLDRETTGRELNKAELDSATMTLQKSVNANPDNLRARSMLAAVYQREGKFDLAEQELRAAVKTNPSNPMQHVKLGDLLKEQGRYKEALREYHFVERLKPHSPLIFYSMGMTYKAMMKCGLSVQYLNRFIKSPQSNNFPVKKEAALQSVEECGGNRPGRMRRDK
jgi:tetratricopeptide (TPR) repeat protein